jgi:hypothetical protein
LRRAGTHRLCCVDEAVLRGGERAGDVGVERSTEGEQIVPSCRSQHRFDAVGRTRRVRIGEAHGPHLIGVLELLDPVVDAIGADRAVAGPSVAADVQARHVEQAIARVCGASESVEDVGRQ